MFVRLIHVGAYNIGLCIFIAVLNYTEHNLLIYSTVVGPSSHLGVAIDNTAPGIFKKYLFKYMYASILVDI